MRLIHPQAWQKTIHEGIDTKLDPKKRSKIAYAQLCPHKPLKPGEGKRVISTDRIDSWLIATHGVLKYGGGKLLTWSLEEV